MTSSRLVMEPRSILSETAVTCFYLPSPPSGAPMTFDPHFAADGTPDLPILAFGKPSFKKWLETQPAARRAWVEAAGFTAEPGGVCLLPDGKGALEAVLFGWDKD